MNLRSEMGKALEPEATWNSTKCICGHTVRVPTALSGKEGTCPKCFRSFITPGDPTDCPRAGGVFVSLHPERELKRVMQEPNFSRRESAYATAQRYAMIPGALYLLATMGICYLLMTQQPSVEASLGMTTAPPWLLPVWLLTVWLAVATCTSTAAAAFHRIAAKSYSQDAVEFAAAGGYDIARWVPLLCYILLYGIYANTLGPPPADFMVTVRDPWLFVAIGAGVGHAATWLVARRVFRSRFERFL